MSRQSDAEARLAESRQALEQRIGRLRTAVDREVGLGLDLRTWALPVLGLGAGLLLAARFGRRKRSLPPVERQD